MESEGDVDIVKGSTERQREKESALYYSSRWINSHLKLDDHEV